MGGVVSVSFFPRGGSAQVARGLGLALRAEGWDTTVVAGSLGRGGDSTHAATFFGGTEVYAVDYSRGVRLDDPLVASLPFQPSYEDRPGAADQVFAAVGDLAYERLVEVWAAALVEAGADRADLLHLHHLTPANAAAARVCRRVPVLGQLHGTELAMLRTIEAGAPAAWTYASEWRGRMRRWAQRCTRLLVAPALLAEACSLLGVSRGRVVAVAGGVDTSRFDRRPLIQDERLTFWRRHLVERPLGWDKSERPGTIAYSRSQLWLLRTAGPIFLYAGRFTEVKRLPLLVRAHARALRQLRTPAPLVLVGGHPDEWEGEHPRTVACALGDDQVFLAGWWPHERLPGAMNAADVFVFPSVAESSGLALVEAMACGLPVVAADTYGSADTVPAGAGWLVPPDDEAALAEALIAAAGDAHGPLSARRSRLPRLAGPLRLAADRARRCRGVSDSRRSRRPGPAGHAVSVGTGRGLRRCSS